ncbi:MAG: hypothetical protein ABSA26_03870 [Thermoguttaceae bacterium]|jgi:hypothetical protein
MRTTLALVCFIFSISIVLADDLEVKTKREKIENGVIITDTYTRKSAIILWVQKTDTHDKGKFIIQRVYNNNKIALEILEMKETVGDGFSFFVKSGNDCDVGAHFTPEGKLDNVTLGTKDGIITDHFTVTDGLLHPMESSKIEKANKIGQDMKKLFAPENIEKSTPAEFGKQVDKLIDKHKKE